MAEKCRLEDLDEDSKLATLYTAFITPKTQQEAIRLIYGFKAEPGKRKPHINRPFQWITETRIKLMESGFLIKTDNKLRNSIIKADIEPIVQSLIDAGTEDSRDPVVCDGVRKILDSTWFRDFFSYEHIHSPITYRNGHVYEPYQEIIKINQSGNRLEITGITNRIFQLLSEVGYYSHNIRWFFKRSTKLPLHRIDDPLSEELLKEGTFDELIARHAKDIPAKFIPIYRTCIEDARLSSIRAAYPERLFRKLLDQHGAIFIPTQVSVLLRSAPCTTSYKPIDCGFIQKKLIKRWREERKKEQMEEIGLL